MEHSSRPACRAFRAKALRLAVAFTLGAAAGLAGAADSDAAVERALGHIRAFPGRTLDGAGQSYIVRDVVIDADGSEHVRVERRYRGLRVIGGDMVVHSSRSGAFVDASRTLTQPLRLEDRARLGAAEALRAARAQHAGEADAAPELVVYARAARPQLAWDVRLSGEQEDGTPSRLHVIIDAGNGVLLDAWDEIETAPAVGTGQSLFDGSVGLNTNKVIGRYVLTDKTRGGAATRDLQNGTSGGGKMFIDADNLWGDGSTANRQTAAVDAHYGAATTWDYFKTVHGRNGIANDGIGADSRVHYGTNYANAFWDDGCFCMTYGDGNASLYPLVSLDVTGHEMSHGVTSRTANLSYSGESGGLNEGTSDIFGSMVEFYADNPNDPGDYLIGEKLYKNGTSYLRSMIKPSVDGKSADCWYSGVGAIDVHYSSGVANHFYFLLAEGTASGQPSPTCNAADGRVATGAGTVNPIGRAKAEQIWYRALTVYMTSNSNYAAARAATLAAATDLYGAGSEEVLLVDAAWAAVKVH